MKRETPESTRNANMKRVFHAVHATHNADGDVVLTCVGTPHEMEVAAEWTAAEMRKAWPGESYGVVQVMVWLI